MRIKDLNFDKVFLINLPHNTDRLARSKSFLEQWELNFEIFEGLYAKNLQLRHTDTKFTPGMVGCFMSHFSIFHRAVSEGWNTIMVLEDDFEPVPGFDFLFEKAWKEVPEDWEFIWLGYTIHDKVNKRAIAHHNQYWITSPSLWGTQCYIVRGPSAIRKIYEDLKTMHDQIDLQLVQRTLPRAEIRQYCIFPSAVGQVGGSTDVQQVKTQKIQTLDDF